MTIIKFALYSLMVSVTTPLKSFVECSMIQPQHVKLLFIGASVDDTSFRHTLEYGLIVHYDARNGLDTI